MMIICDSSDYEAARDRHPDAPILCEDAAVVALPDGRVVALTPYRVAKAIESPQSTRYKPRRAAERTEEVGHE